jgi:hypothetical protein
MMRNHLAPQWIHDCDQCTFLGGMGDWDLYHCTKQPKMPTVIARYSHEPSANKSGMVAANVDPELGEAKERAERLGLSCTFGGG